MQSIWKGLFLGAAILLAPPVQAEEVYNNFEIAKTEEEFKALKAGFQGASALFSFPLVTVVSNNAKLFEAADGALTDVISTFEKKFGVDYRLRGIGYLDEDLGEKSFVEIFIGQSNLVSPSLSYTSAEIREKAALVLRAEIRDLASSGSYNHILPRLSYLRKHYSSSLDRGRSWEWIIKDAVQALEKATEQRDSLVKSIESWREIVKQKAQRVSEAQEGTARDEWAAALARTAAILERDTAKLEAVQEKYEKTNFKYFSTIIRFVNKHYADYLLNVMGERFSDGISTEEFVAFYEVSDALVSEWGFHGGPLLYLSDKTRATFRFEDVSGFASNFMQTLEAEGDVSHFHVLLLAIAFQADLKDGRTYPSSVEDLDAIPRGFTDEADEDEDEIRAMEAAYRKQQPYLERGSFSRVTKHKLPWMEGYIYVARFKSPSNDDHKVYLLGDVETELYLLDGRKNYFALYESGKFVDITVKLAPMYLGFVTRFLRTKDKTFLALDRPNLEGIGRDIQPETKEHMQRLFRKISCRNEKENNDRYLCGATFFHGNTIFRASMAVNRSGGVEMLKDRPLVSDLPDNVVINYLN